MLTDADLTALREMAGRYEAANLEAVRNIIQTNYHPVFQAINDGGRAAANQDSKTKLEAAEAKVTALTTQLTEAQTKVTELTAKTPEAKELVRQHEEAIQKLKDQHAQALKDRDAALATERKDRAMSDLVLDLEKFGVDREYASTVLAKKDEVLDRVRMTPEGKVEVLQAGQKELTITPAKDRTPLSHLAEELAGTVVDKWKTTAVRRGPGVTGSEAGTPGSEQHFDSIRKVVTEAAKKESEGRQKAGEGLARLGGRA
jgi:hypothetical protein